MWLTMVVPFLNEEAHIGDFLESVATQHRRPDQLVLVDDGSTDGSGTIASAFAQQHSWAMALMRPPRPPERDRLASAKELEAFQWGVDRLGKPWDIVAKVDADLRLTAECLARIEDAFTGDDRLGMAGPYLAVPADDGTLVRQRCPSHHVEGPATFYRRECYEAIAPLPPILGWDTMDEISARMHGWHTSSIEMPAGDSVHARPMGSHDGRLRAFRRWGLCAYNYGEHPLHVLAMGFVKARERPLAIGGVNYILGWAIAGLRRGPRAEPELRAYVRRDQARRMRRRVIAMMTRAHRRGASA
jgi:glycosyltransferase involved in cell wall biosynthesis